MSEPQAQATPSWLRVPNTGGWEPHPGNPEVLTGWARVQRGPRELLERVMVTVVRQSANPQMDVHFTATAYLAFASPIHEVVDYDVDHQGHRDTAYTLQLTCAKVAGRNPNNHVVVEFRLVDGTLVHAKFTDGHVRVAAGSVEVPERYR